MWLYIVLPIVLILIILYVVYRRDKKAAIELARAQCTMIETAVGPVEYAMTGQGQPLLVVHGGAAGACDFLSSFEDILDTNWYQVMVPSRPGYRRTPRYATLFAEQAEVLIAFLDAMGFDEPVALMGHSAGGPIALQLAMNYPEQFSALIMLSAQGPGTGPYTPSRFMINLATLILASDWVSWFFSRMPIRMSMAMVGETKSPERLTPEIINRIKVAVRRSFPSSESNGGVDGGVGHEMEQMLLMGEWNLAEVRMPTLVLQGLHDKFVPMGVGKYHAEHIPGAELILYDDGAHYLYITHPEELREAIDSFLK